MTTEIDFHQKAYVCFHVFNGERPILLVTRPDGDWCFLCGDVHEQAASSIRVVGIGHVLEQDESLRETLDLQPDWDAERTSSEQPWIRNPINPSVA
jgi:hypothetical protein